MQRPLPIFEINAFQQNLHNGAESESFSNFQVLRLRYAFQINLLDIFNYKPLTRAMDFLRFSFPFNFKTVGTD